MLQRVKHAKTEEEYEEAQEAIQEDPLSVNVRSGWYEPGTPEHSAEEYCILLCFGGPAVRIVGKLDQYAQPETATLECQDWGTLWESWKGMTGAVEDTLLEYANGFYFGE